MSEEMLAAVVTAGLFALLAGWVPLLSILERLAHHFLFDQPPRVTAFMSPLRGGHQRQQGFSNNVLAPGMPLTDDAAAAPALYRSQSTEP